MTLAKRQPAYYARDTMAKKKEPGVYTRQLVISLTPAQVAALSQRGEERGVSVGTIVRDVGIELAERVNAPSDGVTEKHDQKFSMRLKADDWERIQAAAAKAGIGPAVWIREAVLAKLGLSHLSPFVRSSADGMR